MKGFVTSMSILHELSLVALIVVVGSAAVTCSSNVIDSDREQVQARQEFEQKVEKERATRDLSLVPGNNAKVPAGRRTVNEL